MALAGLLAANNLNDVTNIERTWDNLGSNISATVFVPAPSLDLDFAANKSLVDSVSGNNLITFSRASTGTFVGSNGLVQTAASGVARFDHNPATGESLGLLIEEARTNAFTYSEEFDNAAWTKTNSSITANSTIAPNGLQTADALTSSAAGTSTVFRSLAQNSSVFSVYLKANTSTVASIRILSNVIGRNVAYNVDLSTGTISVATGNTGNLTGWTEYSGIQNAGNGWYRVFIGLSSTSNPTSNYEISPSLNRNAAAGGESIFVWGAQAENSYFPASYIPTSGSTVTRAADVASITGTNFSSWYRQDEGVFAVNWIARARNVSTTSYGVFGVGANDNGMQFIARTTTFDLLIQNRADPGGGDVSLIAYSGGGPPTGVSLKNALCYKAGNHAVASNGSITSTSSALNLKTNVSSLSIGRSLFQSKPLNGTIARLAYYPARLPNATLQALSTYGVVSSFPYSFSIKGKDILALKQVNRASTRDFIFIKGLTSNAQARITTASQYTASGVALRNAAMLKVAPTTSGNYFFSSGLTLSGATCQINGTNALSIATSPFSSSTATVPLLFAGLRPQANWRFTEPMVSGTVTAPEAAIPIETEDFLLFMKAGQS
jgi:hypothetical protein